MSEETSSLEPMVRLQGPEGTILDSDNDYYYSASFSYYIAKSGTYTVFSGDRKGTHTGSYGIYIQNLKNPKNAITVSPGTTYAGSLDVVSELDDYIIYLEKGDTVYARVSEGDSSLEPLVMLYSFNGTLLASDNDYYYSASISYTVSESGNYIVLAGDRHGTHNGKIGTCIIKLKNPPIGTSPKNDQPITATLTNLGEIHNYYFSAYQGQTITVRMVEIKKEIEPMIQLLVQMVVFLNLIIHITLLLSYHTM